MAFRRSIKNRRRRRRIGSEFELPLTSMMDVLVIILVFLLKTYSTSQNNLSTVKGIQLPISSSVDTPTDSHQVIVTPEAITFEDERVVEFEQSTEALSASDAKYRFKEADLQDGGRKIVPLYDALIRARDQSEMLRVKSKARDAQGNPLPFDGIMAIQADKRISYDTVRKIMYTGASAGYRVFRLLAMKRDS
jgi:biopolymer transport protein ExbD